MTPFRKPELPAVNAAVHAGLSGASCFVTPNPPSLRYGVMKADPSRRSPKGVGGFSLIFMSIFILAMAMLMVAVLPDVRNDNARTIDDIDKLNTVEEHMRSFMAFNGRRPCPADGQYPDLGTGSKYFGKEAGTPGVCQGNTAPTPNAPLGPDASGNIVAGVIPTRSIGLSDDYAFDSYGRRFTYVVDRRATSHAFCQNLEGLTLTSTTWSGKGGLYIKDAADTSSEQVMYAYIQYGPSGYGAWPGDGSATTLTAAQSAARRVNSGSTNLAMQMDAAVAPGADPGPSTFAPDLIATLVKNSLITPYTTGGKLDTGFSDLVWYRDDLKNTCCLGPSCIPKGFIVPGLAAYDKMGGSISATGDFDGDGKTDMVIGSPGGQWYMPGNLYVMFGKSGLFDDPTLTTNFTGTGTSGFEITGIGGEASVATAVGNVNGDSYNDLIIAVGGDYGSPGKSNTIYVIYGQPSTYSWPATVNVNSIGTTIAGAVIKLPETDTNNSVSLTLADINGDGIKDIITGFGEYAGTNPSNGISYAGAVYVILGRNDSAGWQTGTYAAPYAVTNPASPGVSNLDGSNGFVVNGNAGDGSGAYLGGSVTTGDLNGDGIDDLVISRLHPWGQYVILGQRLGGQWSGTNGNWPSPFDVTTLNGANGFSITDGSASCWGNNQAFLDLNGDGIKDLALDDCGTYGVQILWGQKLGTSWSGTNGNWTAAINLRSPPANYFTTITNNLSGWGDSLNVASIGDMNGDGVDDLAIGLPTAAVSGNANTGVAWVVYGQKKSWSNMNLSTTLNGSNGFEITGCIAGGNIGNIITGGDINGDGYSDIMFGAPGVAYTYNGTSNTQAGIAYVVYGRKTRHYDSLSLCGL